MLNIDIEFRKGILFVRLTGILVKDTISKLNEEVTYLIKESGICNVVFNIKNLQLIDRYGINAILYNYKLCKNNNGKTLICGNDNDLVKTKINDSQIPKYIYESSDELSAISAINV